MVGTRFAFLDLRFSICVSYRAKKGNAFNVLSLFVTGLSANRDYFPFSSSQRKPRLFSFFGFEVLRIPGYFHDDKEPTRVQWQSRFSFYSLVSNAWLSSDSKGTASRSIRERLNIFVIDPRDSKIELFVCTCSEGFGFKQWHRNSRIYRVFLK